MALDKTNLEAGLEDLVPTLVEAEAVSALSNAYSAYCSTAESSGREIETAALDIAEPIMAAAMVGISVPNAGSQKMTDGFVAFWVSIASNPGLAFLNATAITPPPFVGLKAKLDVVFESNTTGSVSLEDAAKNIADKIDEETKIGGTVTFSDLGGPFPII
jgi:hypothetical protein